MEEKDIKLRHKIGGAVIALTIWILIFKIVAGDFPVITNFLFPVEITVEDVRGEIENYLYDKYGEEFVVTRIGKRKSMDEVFYQARIYPKSIIGTNKQFDDYYYASSSVEITDSGELGGVGDSYSYVVRNIDVEKYLLPEAKNIFGNRILLKVDVQHKVSGDGSWWAGYKSVSLEEMRNFIKDDPARHRIMLDLDIYIFDRIDNEQEKEERRKDIFEFIQYLKAEGLFEYLEMRVIFVDERALAPGYAEFEQEINRARKVDVYIKDEDKTVKLPPEELRIRMSRDLQQEIDDMSEEELIARMNSIEKEDLSYDGIGKWSSHYITFIYSKEMLKEKYPTSMKKNPDVVRNYNNIKDVRIGPNLEYIY